MKVLDLEPSNYNNILVTNQIRKSKPNSNNFNFYNNEPWYIFMHFLLDMPLWLLAELYNVLWWHLLTRRVSSGETVNNDLYVRINYRMES